MIPMVLPRRVESEITESEYGRFIISPLERGYGFTLGASLKRVLLSSMNGAAVTGFRVNEGLPPYAQIPGVREDMARLMLQVKQIRPTVAGKATEPITLRLEHSGAGTVHASEIMCPPNVRILNPELYLFTATEGRVEIELVVEQGGGYLSAEPDGEAFDGFVPLDANFSPITRVVYDVDAARVRQKTNYDKLILEIWTDGTLAPEKALGNASIVMIRYLLPFDPESAGLLEDPTNFLPPPEPEVEDPNPLYDVPIEVLDLSTRVFNSLRRTGITSVGDVIDMLERGEDAMLAIRNFGQTSLDELKEKLIENGYLSDGEDEEEGDEE
ncbi:MAG: DNA-directed RNA polymerase subunit alpha [Chloroflexota bacterium]